MTDITSFSQLDLPQPLLDALASVGYETPSPIQAACIPYLLAGDDLLGEAQTGTGKTAAFALPLLARLDLADRRPQVLVLTPTRELAIQVAEAFQKYAARLKDFHVLPLYGGQSMVVQLRQLARGAHVIVGTPGRIMDHLERKSLKLDALRSLVLDEGDEMLRMGFIDDVKWILEHTPAARQTALFSATMPKAIREVAHSYLRDPHEIKIKAATTTVQLISQRYWLVRGVDKLDALTRILDAEASFDAAIVFARTKIATDDLAERLAARGYAAAALNGDMNQGMRERVIEQLKSGALDIVVATDVAARGIDVPRISHVINYDIPYDTEAYVHRIGRTGRAGREGTAILFVSPRETRMLKAIERATRQPITQISLPSREAVSDLRVSQFKQQILETLESEDLSFFMEIVNTLSEEQQLAVPELAAALAFLAQREKPLQIEEEGRGWDVATRKSDDRDRERSARPARFDDRERAPRKRREDTPRRASFDGDRPGTYRIEVGRNQGITPRDIVGALANEGGIEGRQIGQINLFDDYSTVELPALAHDALDRIKRIRIGHNTLRIRPFSHAETESPYAARPPRRDDKFPGAKKGKDKTAKKAKDFKPKKKPSKHS